MAASRSTSRSVSLTFSLAVVVACGAGGGGPSARPPADLVLVGGEIVTMDDAHPRATALAVHADRISAVGSDADIRTLIGPKTRVVELRGRGVTPGLVDAHSHLSGLGAAIENVQLRGAASAKEAAQRASAEAARRPAGEWLVGRGWDQNLWEDKQFPTRQTLDAAVSDRPVALRRIDGHALWANSKAIELAGVNHDTADPSGGKVLRGRDGKPSGVFVDAAMDLIESKIPAPDVATIRRRVLAASRIAIEAGLTGVHEMGIGESTADVYRTLADTGRLPLRIYAFLSADFKTIKELPGRVPELDRDGTQMFVVRAVKLYADGALGSRGAALLAPYSDDDKNVGLWQLTPVDLRESALIAAESGWQLGIHAIGDAANRAVLDAYEAARNAHPKADLRFRIEHAQILARDDIPRLARLGVIASMQPTHCTSDMPWAEQRVGPERIKGAYAWRSLREAKTHIAFGSDFPIEEVSPLFGLYAATTRQDVKGLPPGGWYPQEKLTLDEAIRAFTVEAAYAAFSEANRGRLAAGLVADITVFDRPLRAGAPLLETKVDMTIVGGKVVFERTH